MKIQFIYKCRFTSCQTSTCDISGSRIFRPDNRNRLCRSPHCDSLRIITNVKIKEKVAINFTFFFLNCQTETSKLGRNLPLNFLQYSSFLKEEKRTRNYSYISADHLEQPTYQRSLDYTYTDHFANQRTTVSTIISNSHFVFPLLSKTQHLSHHRLSSPLPPPLSTKTPQNYSYLPKWRNNRRYQAQVRNEDVHILLYFSSSSRKLFSSTYLINL